MSFSDDSAKQMILAAYDAEPLGFVREPEFQALMDRLRGLFEECSARVTLAAITELLMCSTGYSTQSDECKKLVLRAQSVMRQLMREGKGSPEIGVIICVLLTYLTVHTPDDA
jgi:hypothetical protein